MKLFFWQQECLECDDIIDGTCRSTDENADAKTVNDILEAAKPEDCRNCAGKDFSITVVEVDKLI